MGHRLRHAHQGVRPRPDRWAEHPLQPRPLHRDQGHACISANSNRPPPRSTRSPAAAAAIISASKGLRSPSGRQSGRASASVVPIGRSLPFNVAETGRYARLPGRATRKMNASPAVDSLYRSARAALRVPAQINWAARHRACQDAEEADDRSIVPASAREGAAVGRLPELPGIHRRPCLRPVRMEISWCTGRGHRASRGGRHPRGIPRQGVDGPARRGPPPLREAAERFKLGNLRRRSRQSLTCWHCPG
jgi:hypothetical protein